MQVTATAEDSLVKDQNVVREVDGTGDDPDEAIAQLRGKEGESVVSGVTPSRGEVIAAARRSPRRTQPGASHFLPLNSSCHHPAQSTLVRCRAAASAGRCEVPVAAGRGSDWLPRATRGEVRNDPGTSIAETSVKPQEKSATGSAPSCPRSRKLLLSSRR